MVTAGGTAWSRGGGGSGWGEKYSELSPPHHVRSPSGLTPVANLSGSLGTDVPGVRSSEGREGRGIGGRANRQRAGAEAFSFCVLLTTVVRPYFSSVTHNPDEPYTISILDFFNL